MNPRVACNVENCVHYLPGEVCSAQGIEIMGEMAKTEQETDCATFAKRGFSNYLAGTANTNYGGMTQQLVDPNEHTINPDVKCVVKTCTYYHKGDLCQADWIKICDRPAKEIEETRCSTFEARQ